MKNKAVSKVEFDAFLKAYPNKLNRDVSGIFDPPVLSYNDFTKGEVWPGSVVAWVRLNKDRDGTPDEHFLKVPE